MSRESNQPEGQPASLSDASDFTQLFGKAPSGHNSALPFSQPAQQGHDAGNSPGQGFTAMVTPTHADLAESSAAARSAEPSEAPTQIFAAMPTPEKAGTGVAPREQTRIFQDAAAPQRATEHPVPPSAIAPLPLRSASEFTSVFQPIALPPAMPAPPAAAILEPAGGEFTQFFSAVSLRANESGQSAAPARPNPSPVPVAPVAPKPSTPVAPAGDFTQLFQQQPAPIPVATPGASAAQGVQAGTQEQAQPGSFTQMFSQPSVAASSAAAPIQPPASAQAVGGSQPIFGAAAPRGSFTDIFAANPAQQPVQARPGVSAPNAFPGDPSPFFPPVDARKAETALPPFGASATTPPMGQTASGEFTRLMQSLERPSAPPPLSAQPMPMDAAFFASTPGTAGESEYTRVLRGGGAGAAAVMPSATPAAGSAAAPGLALAPAPKADTAKDKPEKEKPKHLVILLVVMNVLLLVALLVVGLVLLRRR